MTDKDKVIADLAGALERAKPYLEQAVNYQRLCGFNSAARKIEEDIYTLTKHAEIIRKVGG